MKPFDLEAFKSGADAITRDGRKATFVRHLPNATECYKVECTIEGAQEYVSEDGKFCSPWQYSDDLFMGAD